MKILMLLVILFISSCSTVDKPDHVGGYIVPKSCETNPSWVCPGEPECEDEHLKFLCDDWNKK